jgi:hypothetical protein
MRAFIDISGLIFLFLPLYKNRVMSENRILLFENTIIKLKAPLLDATDMETGDNSNQNVDKVLNEISSRMDELYTSIKSIIDNNGVKPDSPINTNTINQVFLQANVNIGEMASNPALKEELITSLNLLLKEYPLTRSREHVIELKVQDTNSSNIIIPNIE